MFTISKRFTFDAAHHLPHLPEGHKCRRPHGHTYTVEVLVEAPELDGDGFVVDFAELHPLKVYLDGQLDHRDLNVVLAGVVPAPTSEHLAKHLHDWCTRYLLHLPITGAVVVAAVRVSETGSTWAEYRP